MSLHGQPARLRAALGEWLWPRRTLALARARRIALPPSAARHLEAARAARRLARAAVAVDGGAAGGSQTIAALLYREAARHGMCALLGCDTASEVATALFTAPRNALPTVTDSAARTSAIRALFRDGVRSELDPPSPAPVLADDPEGKALARDIVRSSGRRVHEYRRILVAVTLRWTVVLAGLSTVLVAAAALSPLARVFNPPDLLAGATWRLSTADPHESQPTGTLPYTGDRPFFFHTSDEDGPWVELKLPDSPRGISRVVVKNRKDCCGFRAIPLVVELSNDQNSWTEVARQQSAFTTWRTRFPAQSARYIRLRVPRKSQLHLATVEAY